MPGSRHLVRMSGRPCLAVTAVIALAWVGGPGPASTAVAAEARTVDVDRALDRGVEFLLSQIDSQRVPGKHKAGQVALETYALVVAGVSVEHPLIEENFAYLHGELASSNHTYSLCCYVFALDAAISQIEQDRDLPVARRDHVDPLRYTSVGREYQPFLRRAVERLVAGRNPSGLWRYQLGKGKDFDNSNVQFVVLALGVGDKRGVSIPLPAWETVVDHFVGGQQKSGPVTDVRVQEEHTTSGRTAVVDSSPTRRRGWDYQNKGKATWNMTCAGASSLLLARNAVEKKLEYPELRKLIAAIRDGLGWLAGGWKPTESYYGMYSLEKVADIGGIRAFGGHDWYREVSSHLVRAQRGNGSWGKGKGPGEDDPRITTSFALLVLARASRLINPVIYTGQSGPPSADDRTWVFVPRLNKHVHYPTLLRTIRFRPSYRIARLLLDVIENQPLLWRGDLLPGILIAREHVEDRRVRQALDEAIEAITGLRDGDSKGWSEWYKRWRAVDELGGKKDKSSVDALLDLYGESGDSLLLKQKVADSLLRKRIRRGIPLILGDLNDSKTGVRQWAYKALQSFYVDSIPEFDATGPVDRRTAQAEAIRLWILNAERGLREER